MLQLYTTPGCHLCEDAEAILAYCRGYYPEVQWRSIDIAEHADLVQQYGVRIPVMLQPLAPIHVAFQICIFFRHYFLVVGAGLELTEGR